MWQYIVALILGVVMVNKIAGSQVMFYFFTGKPAAGIVKSAKHVQERCGVKVIGVVIGTMEGEKLVDAIRRLNKLQEEGFEVWIDPTLYDLFSIKAVPCFVLVPDSFAYSKMCVGEEEVVVKKICGNLDINYVLRRFKACESMN